MNFFEKLLEKKCSEENTRDFMTQWGIDKKLYKKISSGINYSYPSFTDHGINHSETILVNIERLFDKETLETLSSFNIWLLLESAYLHDCGMFISIEKIDKIIQDDKKEFVRYIQEILVDEAHELYKYAKNFKIENGSIFFAENKYSTRIEFSMKFLLSFFKRANHNVDFKDNIENCEKILPSRIYEVLYKICESHGKTFKETLTLSKKESGLGKEIGNPVFIACLLRIGDLLDIDNNRATNLMLEELKNDIPETSQYNLEKHRAITHYWVDSEKVEIKATIRGKNTYKIAEITGRWFSFIEEEFQKQNYSWKDIRPEKFNAFLPKLGELGIEMDEYEYIDSKRKPKFSVDTNSILELLAGENIYEHKGKALRELIQNSIDATYLRIFEENREKIQNNPDFVDLNYFEKYKIQVFIEKNEKESNDELEFYNIKIIDEGIGIDKEQLKYIAVSGSSYKNKRKQLAINEMPLWLQPSGNFGIGFQSIFMLTDKVTLKSKSLYTNEGIEVELLKPTTKNNQGGEIYFKKTKFDYLQKVGTEINFICKVKKEDVETRFFTRKIDFLMKEDIKENIEIRKISNELKNMRNYSLVKIVLNGDISFCNRILIQKLNKEIYSKKFQIVFSKNKYSSDWTKEDLNILEKGTTGDVRFFYKNQYICTKGKTNLIFDITVNILEGQAKDVVTVDRNRLTQKYFEKNAKEILENVLKYCIQSFDKSSDIPDDLKGYFYNLNKNRLKLDSTKEEEMEKYENIFLNKPYFGGNSIKNIEDRLKAEKQFKVYTKNYNNRNQIEEYENELNLTTLLRILRILKVNFEIEYELQNDEKEVWKIKKSDCDDKKIKISGIDTLYSLDNCQNYLKRQFYQRLLIPNIGEFDKLRIKIENKIKINSDTFIDKIQEVSFPKRSVDILLRENYILFPLYYNLNKKTGKWNDKMEDKYVEFVFKNQYTPEKYTIEEIRNETKSFIEYLREKNRIEETVEEETIEEIIEEETIEEIIII